MKRLEDRSQAHLLYLLLERVDRLLADTQDTERFHWSYRSTRDTAVRLVPQPAAWWQHAHHTQLHLPEQPHHLPLARKLPPLTSVDAVSLAIAWAVIALLACGRRRTARPQTVVPSPWSHPVLNAVHGTQPLTPKLATMAVAHQMTRQAIPLLVDGFHHAAPVLEDPVPTPILRFQDRPCTSHCTSRTLATRASIQNKCHSLGYGTCHHRIHCKFRCTARTARHSCAHVDTA